MSGPTASSSTRDADPQSAGKLVADLRSDTVTRPTPEMRRAMAEAIVGDDVYGEDPTMNRLQHRAAEIFAREAALFVPSGSMGNLIAIKVWTHHGNEVICDQRGHINQMEMASVAAISGCLPHTAYSPDGILTWKMIEPLIRPKIYYRAQTGLISMENSHSIAGGTVLQQDNADEICDRAHEAGLPVHLDGARIFNAAVALGRNVKEITSKFDSVTFCLSKGLGAPVGSMLVGSRDFVEKARAIRKMVGGGMRQSGVLAAAGLVALEKMPERLHEDHANARFLAQGLARIPGVKVDLPRVQTNIVNSDVSGTGRTAAEICTELGKQGVLCAPADAQTIRMVTHYDVDRAALERAIATFGKIVKH
ncbi:MAG TPA: GntG family PLP-dependent aldolase [Candidatus Acidoferrales bacterium]|nr:GntG family PLP-dependent aldolase [Candidatus Acidoferrales bacterium]